MNYTEILQDIRAELKFRDIEAPSDIVLLREIKNAIGEINRCRHFTPTDENPYDIKYENMIVPMCIYALAKVGIEGENSHSENGVQRIYKGDGDYPEDLISKIVPLAK